MLSEKRFKIRQLNEICLYLSIYWGTNLGDIWCLGRTIIIYRQGWGRGGGRVRRILGRSHGFRRNAKETSSHQTSIKTIQKWLLINFTPTTSPSPPPQEIKSLWREFYADGNLAKPRLRINPKLITSPTSDQDWLRHFWNHILLVKDSPVQCTWKEKVKSFL